MSSKRKEVHIRRKLRKLLKSRSFLGRIKRRNMRNTVFKYTTLGVISTALLSLLMILYCVTGNSYRTLTSYRILLHVQVSEDFYQDSNNFAEKCWTVVNEAMHRIVLGEAQDIVSISACHELYNDQIMLAKPQEFDYWFLGTSNVKKYIERNDVNALQKATISELLVQNKIKKFFNKNLFTKGDAREVESAGIMGAIMGSILIAVVCLLAGVPFGIATGVYVSEFLPKNWFGSIVEITINNLASVPTVVFGLFGATLWIHFMGLPRSSTLVGGLTLTLIVIPSVAIATKLAIASVPRGIKDAALALGASEMQTLMHHVLPASMKGILRGILLSLARVIGESSPLLMVGMMVFVVDVPKDVLDPAAALPMQIYMWSSNPDIAFQELSAVGILIMLSILFFFNIIIVYIKRKQENFSF